MLPVHPHQNVDLLGLLQDFHFRHTSLQAESLARGSGIQQGADETPTQICGADIRWRAAYRWS